MPHDRFPRWSDDDDAERRRREAAARDDEGAGDWTPGDQPDERLADDLADDLADEEFPLGDGTADDSALVYCPYCGEPAEVALDAGGGAVQQYVEDCPVCCRPWQLTVRYDATGAASVECEANDPD